METVNANDDVMLTTYSNPYDPFKDFDSWYKFDMREGTDCCGILSRMVDALKVEKGLKKKTIYEEFENEETNDELVSEAMEKIVKLHPTMYLMVYPGDKRYTLPYEEFVKTIPNVESEEEVSHFQNF